MKLSKLSYDIVAVLTLTHVQNIESVFTGQAPKTEEGEYLSEIELNGAQQVKANGVKVESQREKNCARVQNKYTQKK